MFLLLVSASSAFGATGIIGWAAGGGTDTLMRNLAAQMPEQIELVNRTGLAGAMALNYVYGQPADGETILMNAENPSLYKLLGYSDIDYDDFECVLLAAAEVVGVIVPADSKRQSFTEIVNAARDGRMVRELFAEGKLRFISLIHNEKIEGWNIREEGNES